MKLGIVTIALLLNASTAFADQVVAECTADISKTLADGTQQEVASVKKQKFVLNELNGFPLSEDVLQDNATGLLLEVRQTAGVPGLALEISKNRELKTFTLGEGRVYLVSILNDVLVRFECKRK